MESQMEALCLFTLLLCSSLVSADLSSPQNVSLQTLNTDYVLRWDWHDGGGGGDSNVTFTAQYLAKYKLRYPKPDWKTVCERESERHCDFSAVQLHYLGMYVLRVGAQRGPLSSPWFTIEFCPDRDAALGPPSAVEVTPVKGLLQVDISDPLTNTNTSMKDHLPNIYYLVQYWKRHSHTVKPEELTSRVNQLILPQLESWTWYCVRVQSRYDFYHKYSFFSPTLCAQTDGQMPYWLIFVCFAVSLLLSFLLVLLLSFCLLKSIRFFKKIFYPSIQLPSHIQEYLFESPGSDMPHLLTTGSEVELCCDRVDVLMSEPGVTHAIMEVHAPPYAPDMSALTAAEQDGRTHSRHGSGDSGMYSTEEGSGQGEELKLDKIGKQCCGEEELDEGVRDVCV